MNNKNAKLIIEYFRCLKNYEKKVPNLKFKKTEEPSEYIEKYKAEYKDFYFNISKYSDNKMRLCCYYRSFLIRKNKKKAKNNEYHKEYFIKESKNKETLIKYAEKYLIKFLESSNRVFIKTDIGFISVYNYIEIS